MGPGRQAGVGPKCRALQAPSQRGGGGAKGQLGGVEVAGTAKPVWFEHAVHVRQRLPRRSRVSGLIHRKNRVMAFSCTAKQTVLQLIS